MASLYPAGDDEFTEPIDPESTPLSQSGGGSRNHVEHHHDLGEAIEAIEANVILQNHDHSGTVDRNHGPKLNYLNTHEGVNTDQSVNAIHHTIDPTGVSATKAAAANHTHDYSGSSITGQPFILCTSGTKPSSPHPGMMIYETDTNRMRVWATFSTAPLHWQLLPVANIPSVRLRQGAGTRQKIGTTPTSVRWNEEVEPDGFGFWTLGSADTITVKEPGLYRITSATQWDPDWVPDIAHIVLYINGQPTGIGTHQFLRGNGFVPGFSQTLEVSGQLRFNANDALTVRCHHTSGPSLLDKIFLYFDQTSQIKSRIDVQFVRP